MIATGLADKISTAPKAVFIIALLLVTSSVFEFYPHIEHQRIIIPEDVYIDAQRDCLRILESRPWYSRLNYWLWFWLISTPCIIFTLRPGAPTWQRSLRTIIAIIFCYAAMNLALHLMWDIRNGPFTVSPEYPWQKIWDEPGAKCANIADGGSVVFTLLFGWIFAATYTGWWLILWNLYHKYKTKMINADYKQDWISKITVFISIALPVLAAIAFSIRLLGYVIDKA